MSVGNVPNNYSNVGPRVNLSQTQVSMTTLAATTRPCHNEKTVETKILNSYLPCQKGGVGLE